MTPKPIEVGPVNTSSNSAAAALFVGGFLTILGIIALVFIHPSPASSEYPRYVAGGQAGGEVQWLVTVPCSHKPTGWQDARSACDWDAIAAVIVTPEVYAAKNQGDPFP